MKHIDIEIEGVTPLLCNRFTEEQQASASSNTSASVVGDRGTPREQSEKKLYLSADGKRHIIPGPNLFRCLIDAGKFFKAGKSKVTTIKSSIIPACVSMDNVEVDIIHKEPWEVDSRPIRNPATGGRRLTHRPMFNDWKLKFAVTLEEEMIAEKTFREIVDAGGKRIGLGDFRPDCKGMFGKFVVTKWKSKNGKSV